MATHQPGSVLDPLKNRIQTYWDTIIKPATGGLFNILVIDESREQKRESWGRWGRRRNMKVGEKKNQEMVGNMENMERDEMRGMNPG